jgi:predicted nucleic acid-binding protein
VSANPKIIAAAVAIEVAVDVLRQMVADPRHVFWPDDVPFTDGQFVAHGAIQGHRQVTDAYLVGLSRRHGGVLATLDAALPASLPPDARRAETVIPA